MSLPEWNKACFSKKSSKVLSFDCKEANVFRKLDGFSSLSEDTCGK